MTEGFSLEHLDVVRFYLVKFLITAAHIGALSCDPRGIHGN